MDRHPVAIAWLRRDLRLDDHRALLRAAASADRVVVAFVLDPALLRGERVGPPIVQFFFDALREVRGALRAQGSDLALLEGGFADELGALARRTGATAVFYNLDYDPSAASRDARVSAALRAAGIAVEAGVDHVLAPADEVLKDDGTPYTVYTPYRRRWNARLDEHPPTPFPSARALRGRLLDGGRIGPTREVPRPEDYGHASSARYPRGGAAEAEAILARFLDDEVARYAEDRNLPAIEGTSRLSPHLRAGTIGIRTCAAAALARRRAARGHARTGAETWLGELAWRDFYQMLLAHRPEVADAPFLEAGRAIRYREDDEAYDAWERGATGYPIVDAGMRQLRETGWMHNRLRMIVASFLSKHLLLDYRRGERCFEQRLADADLAANNGGWQWASSVGTDAAPYFRVFNPVLQGRTFDPDGAFVRRFVPELARVPARYVHAPWEAPPLVLAEAGVTLGTSYPLPIVDHRAARARALQVYGAALGRGGTRTAMSRP